MSYVIENNTFLNWMSTGGEHTHTHALTGREAVGLLVERSEQRGRWRASRLPQAQKNRVRRGTVFSRAGDFLTADF